jgi:hypothetical protein
MHWLREPVSGAAGDDHLGAGDRKRPHHLAPEAPRASRHQRYRIGEDELVDADFASI